MGIKAPADLDAIYEPIAAEMRRLDEFLGGEFQSSEPLLHEILEHVAGFGGKRLRPALLFLCTRLAGGEAAASFGGGGIAGRIGDWRPVCAAAAVAAAHQEGAARRFFDAASSHERRWISYDDMYHEIYNELERERVLADLTDWIGARLGVSAA